MNSACKKPDHGKPFAFICTNPNCSNNRILCSRCLTFEHKACLNHVLEIENILKNSYPLNLNWIRSPNLKQAILTVEKYQPVDKDKTLMNMFQDFLDNEFDKVVTFFTENVNQTKQKIISNVKKHSDVEEASIEGFCNMLKDTYNLDKLSEILKALQNPQVELTKANESLNAFLNQTISKDLNNNNLEDFAITVQTFVTDYLQADRKIFEQFQRSILFDVFDSFPMGLKAWKWDSLLKSSNLTLEENNMLAKRVGSLYGYSTVFGTADLNEGKYQWEFQINTENRNHQWIAFGIADVENIEDVESFRAKNAIGMCTYGKFYNMENTKKLDLYDEKSYLCELDFIKGTFIISVNGIAIAKKIDNIKNKTFMPFATLYRQDNSVKVIMRQIEGQGQRESLTGRARARFKQAFV